MSSEAESAVECPFCGKRDALAFDQCGEGYSWINCAMDRGGCGASSPASKDRTHVTAWNSVARLRLRVGELEAALRGLLDMSESDAADFDHQIAFDECMEAARHQARRALRNEEGAK